MREYSQIEELFMADILPRFGTIVVFGGLGTGKSSLEAKFAVDFMQPRYAKKDLEYSNALCEQLRAAGLTGLHPPEDHLVFCDTFFQSKMTNGKVIKAYETKLIDFGLPSKEHSPCPVCPYGKYFFDEVQDVLDSHKGDLPTYISKAFELARHPHLFIMLAMQRPMRLPKDIREISTFVECCGKENVYNEYDLLLKTVWKLKIIRTNANLERYLDTRDDEYVDEIIKVSHTGNIYECYDPNYFLPIFYAGLENVNIVYANTEQVYFTEDSFKHYHENHSIDKSDAWRKKKEEPKEEKNESRRKRTA